MTSYYSTLCTMCDGPIIYGESEVTVMGRISHEDYRKCREFIRADERANFAQRLMLAGIEESAADVRREALTDLRAKVERLPVVVVDLDPDPHGRPIERRAVLLSDVLAIFG